ncbi:SLAM family member 5-like isoform X2 [Rana temporaria]|uniref:SLAM family member 5-like isoform X2 n=1 Tax=Rana temporaria TaxID=8407 RepID=UPI001AAD0BDF|nr:SLAM family member 5-like isoform X2 [Rana temporaria]
MSAFRMTVPSPEVVLHLCLIVLAFTNVSGGEDVPIILNGLINQSIPMSLSGGPSDPVLLVTWNFKTTPLATYTNNQFIIIDKKFKGRLEILDDGRVLSIGHLRMEDSGLYTGTIIFTDNTNYQKVYNLSVYEPVLTPTIRIAERKKTNDWCNATLNCFTPTNKSSLSYTWKYRHKNSTYQLYNNSGDTIQITLMNDSWDREFLCTVQNPADLKNVSVLKICSDNKEVTRNLRTYGFLGLIVLILIIPLAFLGWYLIMKRKRRKGTPDVTENKNGEPQYIQVTTFQPNDDRQEWKNDLYDCSPRQKPKAVTVYATLEHPPETYR